MKQFFSSIFSSCLGTLLALLIIIMVVAAIGSTIVLTEKSGTSVKDNSVLKLEISAILPEQTNNHPVDVFSFDATNVLGLHDISKSILYASTDPKIKGIYLSANVSNHGYASLKVIRDALLEFKSHGKFIISYNNYLDHKNYYLASVADNIILHPLGFHRG